MRLRLLWAERTEPAVLSHRVAVETRVPLIVEIAQYVRELEHRYHVEIVQTPRVMVEIVEVVTDMRERRGEVDLPPEVVAAFAELVPLENR